MFPSDDIATLFQPDPDAVLRKKFAKLVSWDAETFANAVDIGGGKIVENLAVHAGTDALSWQPGQIVVLEGYDSRGTGGWQTWWITGRVIEPGSGNAASIIDFMRGSLARQISAEIFAERIFSGGDTAQIARTGTTYGNPDSPGVSGPIVVDVPIESGTAIVFISALIKASTEDTASNDIASAGYVSYRISGSTSRAPTDERSALAFAQKYNSGGGVTDPDGTANWVTCANFITETGLAPGMHTFTMEYKRHSLASEPMTCMLRNMVVFGL